MKRERRDYFARYHAEHREARNAAKRAKYVPTGCRPGPKGPTGPKRRTAAVAAYRARRAAEIEAKLCEALAAELERAKSVPELAALIAEQARDGRRYRIKRDPGGFVFDDERAVA